MLRAMVQAWTASEADLYLTSLGSLASADHASYSWKTSQLSLFGGLTGFSWDSMRWGMMRGGQLYQPQRWEPRTFESGYGYWPTPAARDWKDWNNQKEHGRHSPCLPIWFALKFGKLISVPLVEKVMGYPDQWTKLEDWAIAWFRRPRAKHSADLSV